MDRRKLLTLVTLASGVSAVSPVWAQFDLGKMLDAGKDLAKSESLSDEELKSTFDQMSAEMDSQNQVAPAGNPFAMANGTIRVYSGLMDKFTDDEVRYVIGHEIGHVKAGHTKARIQTALRTSALSNAVASSNGKAGAIASSQLGDLFEKVVRAQHSHSNEREADDYAMGFMKAKRYQPAACVTALEKLAAMSGGDSTSFLSTHPSPKERADRMKTQVAW